MRVRADTTRRGPSTSSSCSASRSHRAGAVTRRTLITSSANDRLKAVRRLARRRSASSFLLEGHRQLRRALEAEARSTRSTSRRSSSWARRPRARRPRRDAWDARRRARRGAPSARSRRATRPDGLLAVARRWPTTSSSVAVGACPLLLVAEGIERPGNLGTLVRSACSSGATGLLACDARTEVFHPDAVRGSVGTLFHLPVAECTSGDGASVAARARRACRRRDARGRASLLGCTSRRARRGRRRERAARRLARWRDVADELVSIPMPGSADSLNVAVAAGIVLFEAVRQRMQTGVRRQSDTCSSRRRRAGVGLKSDTRA